MTATIFIDRRPIICGRTTEIIRLGLSQLQAEHKVKLTDYPSTADYVLFPVVNLHPRTSDEKTRFAQYVIRQKDELRKYDRRKLVIIDNSDIQAMPTNKEDYKLIFKRSLWSNSAVGKQIDRINDKNLLTFDYCFLPAMSYPAEPKTIPIAAYLRPTEDNLCYRRTMLDLLKSMNLPANHYLGEVSNGQLGKFVRDERGGLNVLPYYCPKYFSALARTSLSCDTQPNTHVSTNRLWESIANRALVLTDKLFACQSMGAPLVDGEHVFMFDWKDGIAAIQDKIGQILTWIHDHPNQADKIRDHAKDYILTYHSARARMANVLSYL